MPVVPLRRPVRGRGCVAWLLVQLLLGLALPTAAAAQPDFSQSTLTHEPPHVTEGDVVTFVATVRNSGNEPAPYAEIEFLLPEEALIVDMQGLDAAAVDHAEKRVAATVSLDPGAALSFRTRVVVPRDAGGNVLRPALRIRYLHRHVTFETGEPIDIDTAPATGGIRVGGVRIRAVEGGLLLTLLLYPLLWIVLPRRRRNHGSVLALTLGTGFLALFGMMAWRDWQTLNSWRETACTVLDTRLRIETHTSQLATQSSGEPRRRTINTNYKPLLALQYEDARGEVISTGYETGTRLGIGRNEALQREYAGWRIGTQVPCWYDPAHSRDVVVVRGFGGAYLFALMPLTLLGLGVLSVTRWR